MAIDIVINDKVDDSIEEKLRKAANAAGRLNKNIEALGKSLGGLNNVGMNSVISSLSTAFGGGGGRGSSVSRGTRSVESAAVTASKQLIKQRNEITKVFEDGFNARKKQQDAIAAAFNKSEKAAAAATAAHAKRVAAVESAAVTALKQQQKTRDEITKVFTQGLAAKAAAAQSVASAAAGTIPQLAAPKNLRAYVDQVVAKVQPSSVATRQFQQNLYDGLFNAVNLQTLPTNAWQAQLNTLVRNTKPSSAATKAAQQNLYNNLFSAVPTQAASPSASSSAGYATAASNMNKAAAAQKNWTASANNTATAMQRLEHSVSFLRSDGLRWAKVLWALGGATLTAHAIVDAADAYTRLQNRLAVVAESQGQVNQLTDEMLRIATTARQPIEQTAKTFVRFDLAMQQLGRSQKDSAILTENVAKALKLGGATAGESASAMLQLSQAFNKGKLDGDEFRSMMENSPILADKLAKSLNATRGELLKLAPEGKITADVMAKAWIGATDDINKAFAKLRPTIAESFVNLRSEITVFFGRLDQSIGFTAGLANAISFLSKNLDVLTFAVLAVTPVLALFVGTQVLAALQVFIGYTARTAQMVGALRSPVTIAATAIANMGRAAVIAGAQAVTAFTSANTRAIALQLSTVRAAAAMAAFANVARTAAAATLAAFSFGNILLVIGVAIAAAIAFGDQLILNAKSGATMRDYTVAAFQEIGAVAKDVFVTMYDAAVTSFGGQVDQGQTFGQKVADVFFKVGLMAASVVDAISTVFNNLWKGVKSVVYLLGDAIYNTVALLANSIISLVNGAIDSLNSLSSAANLILDWTGASSLVGNFGKLGKASAIEYKSQLKDSLGDFSMENGAKDAYLQFVDNFKARGDAAAAARNSTTPPTARTPVDPSSAADGKGKKGRDKKSPEERRAEIIAKVVNEENKAIAVSKRYGDERERLNVVEELNNKLKEKGYAQLSAGANGEREMIANLVQQRIEAERIGEAMQSMYDSAHKPQLDFNAAQQAAKNLLEAGAINAGQYASQMARVKDELAAATDPAHELVKQLDNLKQLQGFTGDDRTVGAAVYDARENARSKGMAFTDEDAAKVAALQRSILDYTRAADAAENITSSTKTALTENSYAITAMNNAYKSGAISVGMYRQEVAALLAEQGRLGELTYGINPNDMLEPLRRGFYQFAAEVPQLGQGMADAISSTLGNAVDNISSTLTNMIMNFDAYAESVEEALQRPVSTLDVIRYALADIVIKIGQELIGALIKMGVQMAIQAALGKSIEAASAAATVATQTATATAVNAAWTPAAISASIATMGGASATGLTGFMTAQAVGKASSLIPAFADGGILGGMGTGRSDSTLFWGSRGEMIMNRDAVAANQPMLQAMNSGAQVATGGYVDNSTHVTVYIQQDGTTTQSGEGNEFTRDMVRFIDQRVQKGITASQKQGKSGY